MNDIDAANASPPGDPSPPCRPSTAPGAARSTTRAALLTAAGPAALATIALAGADTLAILQAIFRPRRADLTTPWSSERPRYGTLLDADEVLDEAIVAADPQVPSAEIHCHGGPRLVQRVLLLLHRFGVEIVPWQQFLAADGLAAEAALALPHGLTRTAALAIAAQYPTGLAATVRDLLTALDRPHPDLPAWQTRLSLLVDTYPLAQRLLNPPTVVLAGPANVGKSTLANALTGCTQSLVADLPGTTRDWTAGLVEMHGLPVQLIDTPGRREAADALEQRALARADRQLAAADLLLLVLEAGPCLGERLPEQLTALPPGRSVIVVANKTDLYRAALLPPEVIGVSALRHDNLEGLRAAVAAHFGLAHFDPTAPLVFTERQRDLLLHTLAALSSADALTARRHLQQIVGD